MMRTTDAKPFTSWRLISAFWRSEHRWTAYLIVASVIIMTIALVAFDVVLNYWYNFFYDALQDYNKHNVLDLLAVFVFLAAIMIILAVYRYYL